MTGYNQLVQYITFPQVNHSNKKYTGLKKIVKHALAHIVAVTSVNSSEVISINCHVAS